ncbi:MAG: hypothetical protein WDO16_03440 [Bacteroidota bacterium]
MQKSFKTSGNNLLQLMMRYWISPRSNPVNWELSYETVSLADIINDVKRTFTPMAVEKNIDFRIEEDENIPEQVETDKMRVEQILKTYLISQRIEIYFQGLGRIKSKAVGEV